MTQAARYQTQRLYAEQGQIRTYQGLDPLTGLPVLIYHFPGRPMPQLGGLESENIPGVLASSYDAKTDQGQLVVAHASGYTTPTPPLAEADFVLLLRDSARALRDAAEAGVVHGDLRPERFLHLASHTLLEGYGVRWKPSRTPHSPPELGSSLDGDIFSWASSLLHFAAGRFPNDLRDLIEACLAIDPAARPSAHAIYQAATQLAGARLDAPPSPLSSPRLNPPKGESPGEMKLTPAGSAARAKDRAGFVKSPPPGAIYRSGDTPPKSRAAAKQPPLETSPHAAARNRRLVLLTALVISAAVLALLALWRRNQSVSAFPTSNGLVYYVDVAIIPDDLNRVELIIVESPPGARIRPGSIRAYVPGPVLLEQAGTWVLRARFQERVSADTAITVPEERSLVLELLDPTDPPAVP